MSKISIKSNTELLKKLIRVANDYKSEAANIRTSIPFSMLSDEEITLLDLYMRMLAPNNSIIAELGAYVGGTSVLFGRAKASQEVHSYDMFEHNPASRERLAADPLYEKESFYNIWQRNIYKYKEKIIAHKGNLLETAHGSTCSFDILYVDIVKHESIVNIVAKEFYNALKVGGVLFHQDYFHFQSPWLVYQMEALSEYFDLVGDIGFNMTVYTKIKEIPEEAAAIDFINGLSYKKILDNFDKAINRHSHAKAGMLSVSKLNYILMNQRRLLEENMISSESIENEKRSIEHNYASPRVHRYLNSVLNGIESRKEKMW